MCRRRDHIGVDGLGHSMDEAALESPGKGAVTLRNHNLGDSAFLLALNEECRIPDENIADST